MNAYLPYTMWPTGVSSVLSSYLIRGMKDVAYPECEIESVTMCVFHNTLKSPVA